MSEPTVSICIPTYNAAGTLRETLESILAQSYTNLRVIVADNVSTDNTFEIAQSYAAKDARVQVVRHENNIGGEANFRWCAHNAPGDYIAVFHSDDVYGPDMVASQVRVLAEEPDVGVVFTGAHIIDEKSQPIGRYRIPATVFRHHAGKLKFDEALRLALQYGNFFICPSAMARREVWHSITPFQGNLFKTSADLATWLSILHSGCFAKIIEAPLMSYRASTQSYSFNFTRQRRGPHDILLVLDHYAREYADRLGPRDRQNQRFYHFKDAVNRAINALIQGEPADARALVRQQLSWDVCRAATHSLQQAKLFAIGLATLALSVLPLGGLGRSVLRRVRFG